MKILKRHHLVSRSRTHAVTAVTVVRNEMARLPGFFAHHRRLGVSHFVVIDNDSEDGTRDYLLDQSDITLLYTRKPYGDRNAGQRKWINDALQDYCLNSWALVVDADELFVYECFESEGIESLCRRMALCGAQGIFAFLLDMYRDSYDHGVDPNPA